MNTEEGSQKSEVTFMSRLERAMKARGINSYHDLSRKISVFSGTISSWKNLGSIPQKRTLSALSDALNVPVEWLNGSSSTEPNWSEVSNGSAFKGAIQNFFIEKIGVVMACQGITQSLQQAIVVILQDINSHKEYLDKFRSEAIDLMVKAEKLPVEKIIWAKTANPFDLYAMATSSGLFNVHPPEPRTPKSVTVYFNEAGPSVEVRS